MSEEIKEKYINPYTDFEQAEIARFSPEERRGYEDSVKAYRDINNAINTAKKDSVKEVAKRMKVKGYSDNEISEMTNLSLDEIAAL